MKRDKITGNKRVRTKHNQIVFTVKHSNQRYLKQHSKLIELVKKREKNKIKEVEAR